MSVQALVQHLDASDYQGKYQAMPRVSVLMPVFNAERYVEAAVRSVLGQTFRDFELLVVDDGSTDSSPAILRRLAALDSRIHLTSRANVGLIATLNELLTQARGELVARMDADDLSHPERFSRQVLFLKEKPAVVAVGSRVVFIDADGLPLMEAVDHFSHGDIDAALLGGRLGIVHPSVMIRAAACKAVGGFQADYTHAEDLDFFLRLGEVGMLANVPEPMLEYRVHDSSVSHRFFVDQSRSADRAIRRALERRGLDSDPTRVQSVAMTVPETRSQLHRKWAWWALGAGNVRTARKHATRAMMAEPWSWQNLRVLACALRGSFKARA